MNQYYATRSKSVVTVILLSIITCGIYAFIWMYQTTRDLNEYTDDYRMAPGIAVLLSLITCGLYQLFWWYRISQMFMNAQHKAGYAHPNDNKVLFIILSLFGMSIVSMAILQSDLNMMWEKADTPSVSTDQDEWSDY